MGEFPVRGYRNTVSKMRVIVAFVDAVLEIDVEASVNNGQD